MKVYMHPESGHIALVYPVHYKTMEVIGEALCESLTFVGLAAENEKGVTFIFPEDTFDGWFYLGRFDDSDVLDNWLTDAQKGKYTLTCYRNLLEV